MCLSAGGWSSRGGCRRRPLLNAARLRVCDPSVQRARPCSQWPQDPSLAAACLTPSPHRCLPPTFSSVEDPEHEAPVPPRHSLPPSLSLRKRGGRGGCSGPQATGLPPLFPCPGPRPRCLPCLPYIPSYQGQATTEGRRWKAGSTASLLAAVLCCCQSAMELMMPWRLPRPALP